MLADMTTNEQATIAAQSEVESTKLSALADEVGDDIEEDKTADLARRETITEATRRNSSLLKLPAEVRNTIYEYALRDRTLRYAGRVVHSRSRSMHHLPLTCRQLYEETHLLV
ncbi:hypothetical protein BU23DRAFT_634600 [Bimuria novae-zelandiae CBS 107.79]|uniref:Uncharacterized protein n=1 Tax=Bimuria novae-zelandiae CBS 107.79 TaxID=1447943 RepID=A0A6A5VHP3_9PLEO|nr:hypothetical protein BU23DRAFT_634600 [Bimuria novae-zelandiae CBS 107.79]